MGVVAGGIFGLVTNLASSLLDGLGLPGWVIWPLWLVTLAVLVVLLFVPAPATGYIGDHAQARAALLERLREVWIEGALEHSLYEEARVELGLTVSADRPHPWRMMTATRRAGRDRGRRPANAVAQVYDELGKVVLLLGAPGAGKTTLLLELLRELLTRAQADQSEPLPVVLQLPGWAAKREPLAQWMAREIGRRYEIPLRYAEAWVAEDRLAVLLDGLDEVAAEHREDCVREINAFRRDHGFTPLVVCSRTRDYEKLNAALEVYGTLTILPLDRATVRGFLDRGGDGLAGMRAALHADPELWELLDSPLLLSVMALAYRDGVSAPGTEPLTVERRRAVLFSDYTVTMLARRHGSRFHLQQTVTWLAFLAHWMNRDAQVSFTPDRVREIWGLESTIRFKKLTILGWTGCLALVLPAYVVSGWNGVLAAVCVGALFGRPLRPRPLAPFPVELLVLSVEQDLIRRPEPSGALLPSAWEFAFRQLRYDFRLFTVRDVRWQILHELRKEERRRRRPDLIALGLGVVLGPLLGGGRGTVVALAGYAVATAVVMMVTVAAVQQFARPVAQSAPRTRWSEVPSPHLWAVLATGARTALALGAACGAFAGLVVAVTAGPGRGLAFAALVGFGVTLYGLGLLGGWAVLEQAAIRRGLRREGLFPLPSRPFLGLAAECLFLRPVGEEYIFVHRSLMEFFAALTDRHGRIGPRHLDDIVGRVMEHPAYRRRFQPGAGAAATPSGPAGPG
ncbi:NACHT domain-containing protein [Sphaerisporangium melleum]|uniref:NACHT domain-containing protein n=1 Tax=Sphaerisporangium melleum TaxID=321316 RepID=UPI001665678A|nr:NACHT domain-containing protein [Sphaerisporangium melleum]